MSKICLVGCGKRKRNYRTHAADMYTSSLFRKAREYAVRRFDRWYILSAKYGILDPNQKIDAYEMNLKKLRNEQRNRWAHQVYAQIQKRIKTKDHIAIIAGIDYRSDLLSLMEENGYCVRIPLEGLGLGKQLHWLDMITSRHDMLKFIDRYYSLLNELRTGMGGTRVLKTCSASMKWPSQGVYFFFEPGEYRKSNIAEERVVRVGTHNVSKGSKSTFWHRLRTHKGTGEGRGNHRSSIFRLHVGTALRSKFGDRYDMSTWGKGQSVSKEIRQSEVELEEAVSTYLGEMKLLWLDVADAAGPTSDRAYIERNVIALLAGLASPIDTPSVNWLGAYSSSNKIRRSGLWNIDYIDSPCDPRFLDVMARYVDVTLGRRKPFNTSLAPADWHIFYKNQQCQQERFPFSLGEENNE